MPLAHSEAVAPVTDQSKPSTTVLPAEPDAVATRASFADWLSDFRSEALRAGISASTLDHALSGLQPNERVIELDKRQPEFVKTFWNYYDARLTDWRIRKGKENLGQHANLLAAAETRYGIPANILVAFWGLETNYGGNMGNTPLIPALATLAYDDRRASFFRGELLNALRMIDAGNVPLEDMMGSWAGAFGHMQFMPSTYLHYAVDGDGDGLINTRSSLPDAIESAAHYLQASGWQRGENWGEEVALPSGFDWHLANANQSKTLQEWARLGVTRVSGAALADTEEPAKLVLPQGHDGPAILVQHNYDVMMRWNRSHNYALMVGFLANRLVDKPGLLAGRGADNRNLSHEQAIDLQLDLKTLGFDPGPADGRPGTRTRTAIRAYQDHAGLPADGHPSVALLDRLGAEIATRPAPTEPSDINTNPTPP